MGDTYEEATMWDKLKSAFGPTIDEGLTVPPLPEGAPDEQLLDRAGVVGAMYAHAEVGWPRDEVRRMCEAYRRKWHDE